jgi:hypothetical protein
MSAALMIELLLKLAANVTRRLIYFNTLQNGIKHYEELQEDSR